MIKKDQSKRFPEYYKRLYPNWTDIECNNAAIKFKKSCNYQCIEYYEKLYPGHTKEEYIQMKKEAIYAKQKNNPLKIEYYKEHYPELSEEEQKKLHKQYTSKTNYQCIEYYQNKYPELSIEECENLRKEAIKSYTSKRDQTGERNGMHHSKTTEYKRRSISPRCIEFYEVKFPELSHDEQLQKLKNFLEFNRQKVKDVVKDTNLEYYLQKGLSEEEAILALKNRQCTFSLEKCINKYGEEEGRKVFNARQLKWLASLYKTFEKNGDGRSKQSKFAKEIISYICKSLKIDYPKHEKYIMNKNTGKPYAYDFCYEHKIIEFNSDYWHANPSIYSKDWYCKTKKEYAIDIWAYDKEKENTAKMYGYDIIHIWESDYNNNPIQIMKQCYDFITNS